jgi:hypothetical protein
VEEKFVQAYLTDAANVAKVYGCKNKALLEKLLVKLKYPLEDLDDEFEDLVEPNKNANMVLMDIINGKQTLPDFKLVYLFLYEQICLSFGEHIYAPSDDFSVNYFNALELQPSAFMPLELSNENPVLLSIPNAELEDYKMKFLNLSIYKGIDEIDFGEEQKDYAFAFDLAIKMKKDLVFCMS